MATNGIHVGDVGTVFTLTVMDGTSAVDVSAATTKQMVFLKPDGSKLTTTASFATDGKDGQLTYAARAGDLDQTDAWKVEVAAALGSWSGHSDAATFTVYPIL